jgi:transcription initiation factor TFIIB
MDAIFALRDCLSVPQEKDASFGEDMVREDPIDSARGSARGSFECDCGGSQVILEEGNYVCKRCFTIVARFIDGGPEWRYFGAEHDARRTSDPARCGPPNGDLVQVMGSIVGHRSMSSSTSTFGGTKPAGANSMQVVQRYQFWHSMSYKDRTLCAAFGQMSLNGVGNGLSPCIIDEAKVLYKRMIDAKAIARGDNRKALVAACVYISCKSNNVPRSVKEIAAAFNVKTTCLTKACKLIQDRTDEQQARSSQPQDFIGRFCSRLAADLTPDRRPTPKSSKTVARSNHKTSPEGPCVYDISCSGSGPGSGSVEAPSSGPGLASVEAPISEGTRVDIERMCRAVVQRAQELLLVTDTTPPTLVAGAILLCAHALGVNIDRAAHAEACMVSAVTAAKCYKKLLAHKAELLLLSDLLP